MQPDSGHRRPLHGHLQAFAGWLFSRGPACIWCGRGDAGREAFGGLCPSCWGRVPWVGGPRCLRCGKPLPEEGACTDCRSRVVPFEGSRAPAVYDGLWRDLIHALKFAGRRELAEPLGAAMARLAVQERYPERCHVLVPVPLDPERLRRRGFNQSRLLADSVSRRTGIPVLPALVRHGRRGQRPAQSLRSVHERRQALRRALVVARPAWIRGLVAVVVDDVYTTGATLDEAARSLLRAGVRKVVGLVAAVGLTDRDLDPCAPAAGRPKAVRDARSGGGEPPWP